MNESYTSKNEPNSFPLLHQGEVVLIDDNSKSGILKIRIDGIDNNVSDADLPSAYPVFNFAFFRVLPKKGERVFVFLSKTYSSSRYNQEKRYWFGISISSISNIYYDPFYYTASSHESDGWVKVKNVTGIPKAIGTYPNEDEIGIYGRKNTDLVFKDEQIILRAGRHLRNNVLEYNKKDPAYVQIKYTKDEDFGTQTKTVTKLVTIDPEYKITATLNGASSLVKVIRIKDNLLITQTNQTYTTNTEAIAKSKETILGYQQTYKKFMFQSNNTEYGDIPTMFVNNSKIVKQQAPLNNTDKKVTENSVINIVANKINILSHLTNNYKLTDQAYTIDPQEQLKINDTAHPMVYGDKLIEFMKLIKEFITTHVHPYNAMSPVKDPTVQKILNFDLNQLINENIRLG